MIGWLPDWSTAEWSQVLATVAAAIAAIGAAAAVYLSLRQQRLARRPNVSGGLRHGHPSGALSASFVNGGPGIAVQISYMIVSGNRTKAGLINRGHLGVHERVEVDFGWTVPTEERSYLVWGCSDVDWNVYMWSIHWKHRRISRRRWLKREDKSIATMFALLHPDVSIPS